MIEDEYRWAARRSVLCGLHVHIGVGGADRTLAVYNALRSFLPEVAALAANSPFFEGEDTELCSIRPKLLEALSRTGVPPVFPRWADFVAFVDWGRTGGLFPDGSFLWWDLRPHVGFGTLELRVADAQTRVEDAGAIAGLVQTLVAWLGDRFDRGADLPVHESHRIAENAWRAVRYGVRGELVDLESGRREPTRDRIGRLLETLGSTADRLGNTSQLEAVGVLLAGNGADRQRYVAERDGLVGLVSWLADETAALPVPIGSLAGAGARSELGGECLAARSGRVSDGCLVDFQVVTVELGDGLAAASVVGEADLYTAPELKAALTGWSRRRATRCSSTSPERRSSTRRRSAC